MRTQKITELGEILFENVDTSEKLWGELLGKDFHKTWEEPETALRRIVDTAQANLNRNNIL